MLPSGILPFREERWRPTQTEFSRLNLEYTVLSKRKLIQLVTQNHVDGWDDPRMPTITGLRRRGYPSKAIKLFCERVGISRAEGTIGIEVFEETMREHLDDESPRIFAVVDPLKVTLTNYDASKQEQFTLENHPRRPEYGSRAVPFSSKLYIDKADFFDTGPNGDIAPPKGYKRLLLDGTVRLKYGYVVHCHGAVRDPVTGEVTELLCTYDESSSGGKNPVAMKKPKGIVQWVSQPHAVPIHLNVYDRLFLVPSPGKDQPDGDFLKDLNPNSKTVVTNAFIEPAISDWKFGSVFQFERLGYYYLDPVGNGKERHAPISASQENAAPLIFNRVVSLKDTWQQTLKGAEEREATTTATARPPPSNKKPSQPSGNQALSDYEKLDIRIGEVKTVEKHPDADSLYVQTIDCGDEKGPRTVVSGLVKYLAPDQLLGQKVIVLCNLKQSKLRGILSEGMVLTAVVGEGSALELLQPASSSAKAGDRVLLLSQAVEASDKGTVSKDVWTRISSKLAVDESGQLSYTESGAAAGVPLVGSGPVTAKTIKGASVQ